MARTMPLHVFPRPGAHALELEGVGRQFGALVALADINLRVGAGERRAVLGSNGAGKTTLFNAVTGDFPADVRTHPLLRRRCDDFSGARTDSARAAPDLSDQPALRRPDRDRQHLCRVPRRFARPTLAAAAAPGTTRQWRRRESIAHAVHLDDILRDACVRCLSHGQQRQLEIALALSGAPRFILFDEPAAGLSPSERRDLVAILNALPPISATSSSSTISTSRCAFDLCHDDAQRAHLQGGHAGGDRETIPRSRRSTSEPAMAKRPAATATKPILKISDLQVYYGECHALQGVSLTLERGVLSWSAATAWARRRCATRSSA